MSYPSASCGKYIVCGALTFVVYLAAGALFLNAWSQEAIAASAAFLVAVAFNYLIQQLWVFRGRVAMSASVRRYAVMITAGFLLNAAVVHILANRVPMPIAQIGAAAAVIVANALISFAWVYARTSGP